MQSAETVLGVLRERGRRVSVPETLRTLCDVPILVDQSAEPVVSSDVVHHRWGAAGEGP